PVTGRFHAVHGDPFVLQEGVEQTDGIGPTTNAGDQCVGQAAGLLPALFPRLATYHALEVTDHLRIGMRAGHGADDVDGVIDVGNPVAHGFVHRVLQRLGAGGDRNDLGTEQLHAIHVQRLTLDVLGAHVDLALEAEARRYGCGGHAVLTGTGLGDHPRLAHVLGQHGLTDDVAHLVRAGVVQVLALEPDLCATDLAGQPLGKVQR